MGPGGVVWGIKSRETVPLNSNGNVTYSALLLCPCLFCPNDNVWRSRRTDAPRCTHISTVISPSWITEQISVEKCALRGPSTCRERQTSFKTVTWTKQTWTKHHNTVTYNKIHITLIHCHNQFRFCSVTIIPCMDVHFIHLCFVWEALDVMSLDLAKSRQQRGVNVRPPADPVDQIVIGQNITWTLHYKSQGKIVRWTRHPGQDITWTKQTWTTQQATHVSVGHRCKARYWMFAPKITKRR
jgi:hypothetical protein